MPTITNIQDLRVLHQKHTPRLFYQHTDSGSWSESTYRANEHDLQQIRFRQRVAVDLANRTTGTTMLGQPVAMPVALAPTGLAGLQHADGEILAAQAAEQFGVPFCLSTMSICSIEDVASHTTRPFWFQLYVMKDRAFTQSLIQRAQAVGCSALMLTMDLQILGQRHKDVKNGLTTPGVSLKNLLDIASRPQWCWRMLNTPRRTFGNIVGHASGVTGSPYAWIASQLASDVGWSDVDWVRQLWKGPLIIKGIMDPRDAVIAADHGADAIVVSNHGGRQLDGAVSTIQALPEILEAVDGRAQIWMDGGIRSGQDVLRAWAMGAQGTMIGRPWLYGLGALGKKGVTRCLEIIHKELDLTMAFTGHRDIHTVTQDVLYPGTFPTSQRNQK